MTTIIKGLDQEGKRIHSMDFERMVRKAAQDSNELLLESYGQHNIGIRLEHEEGLHITVTGPSGQRLGCMGMPGTKILCKGASSDDVGYLNIGAEITVLGDASNGVCNAMAAGKVFIAGSIGARGLTMTKWNPEYEKPELWVLGSTGDSFAEFNCGGVAVVCGVHPKNPTNILGYRPCVGMVGGNIYFRGPIDDSFASTSARLATITDEQWHWLTENMAGYLEKIGRPELYPMLTVREEWQMLTAITPQERALMAGPMSMTEFRDKHWTTAFGGDPLRDLAPGLDRSVIPAIVTGDLRRKKPWWNNDTWAAPCTYYCPIHIPTVKRLKLIREEKFAEAYELVLSYTPLPASVCGAVCPNPCMENCSRKEVDQNINMQVLGQAINDFQPSITAQSSGKKVAIIGGGPAGMNAAWQLVREGVTADIFEQTSQLGGKLAQVIPWERLPQAVWDMEMKRFLELPGIKIHFNRDITKDMFLDLRENYDYVIIAIGNHEPRRLQFPGHERVIAALDFLKTTKTKTPMPVGKEVVVIGAGNVGCDVACEAYRLGADKVTLVDIQKPQAFGKEKAAAEQCGATFLWPVTIKEVTTEGLVLDDQRVIAADTVFISIGDVPALNFLPENVETLQVGGSSWIATDKKHLTSDNKVLAIGDVERPGLATNALGAGKEAAEVILADIKGHVWEPFAKPLIPKEALTISHYAPEHVSKTVTTERDQAERCLSCASCRDCHLCETICPTAAITRQEVDTDEGFAYVSDDEKCIGCGFCADTCPCGIWQMHPQ